MEENRTEADKNGKFQRYDLKNFPKTRGRNDDDPLRHARDLAGNYIYGAEAAAAGLSLDFVSVGGNAQNLYSSTHRTGTLDLSQWTHSVEKQQAAQDGWNWWHRNAKKYGGTLPLFRFR